MAAQGDSELAIQLAQRLLANPYSPDGYPAVELLPGRLPADLSIDLAMPVGGRVFGSAIERRDGELSAVQVIVDVDPPRADAAEAYVRQLRAGGWREPDFGGRSGFISSSGGPPRMLRKPDQGPMLMISSVSRAAGEVELRLRLDFLMPRHMPREPHGRPEPMDLMPVLYAPDGVLMEGVGGGGSDQDWSSTAAAKTGMPVADLESFFADQLLRAGWTRLARDSSHTAAWSSWTVSGRDEWRAISMVVAAPDADERWVSLRMRRRLKRGGGGWASAVSSLVRH